MEISTVTGIATTRVIARHTGRQADRVSMVNGRRRPWFHFLVAVVSCMTPAVPERGEPQNGGGGVERDKHGLPRSTPPFSDWTVLLVHYPIGSRGELVIHE